MNGRNRRFLALILVAILLLTGCSGGGSIVPYDQMVYERPDMSVIQETLDVACEAAKGDDADLILKAVFDFYDAYDWFYTCYSLADLHYSSDLTDIYWKEESEYCVHSSAQVDAALETLYYALADSPCREALERLYFGEGFFESYDGENLWDAEFTAMLEKESRLQSRYYELSEQALALEPGTTEYYDACADEMALLLVELIRVRQEMAEYWGYSDYAQFASDFYYSRDYTMAELDPYLKRVSRELVPIYRRVNRSDVWDEAYRVCPESEAYAYVRTAANNMGGIVKDAFDLMERGGYYDIAYSPNKYSSSFEVYLTYYGVPFLFMNPSRTVYDKLTMAHEFGHFCNDFASKGSYAGVDVLEVFSQGMEFLTLCYGEDTQVLVRVKMADCLCTYVEQAAFATFEREMYLLKGEDLTVENLYALYGRVAQDFGFDAVGYDNREFVDIPHFYTNPMYVVSYVVSNDAALQIYQLERSSPGAGLKLFENNIATEEYYFLAFLESAGLKSPFAPGRLTEVRKTFEGFFP